MIVIHTIFIFHEPFSGLFKIQGFEQESLESVRHFCSGDSILNHFLIVMHSVSV